MCSVNLQHQCHIHKCTPSGAIQIIEGHQHTPNTCPTIVHQGSPDDLVLNTAKMHSAKHIQQLCKTLIPLDMDWAIMEGSAHETDNQKSTQQSTSNPQGQASSLSCRKKIPHTHLVLNHKEKSRSMVAVSRKEKISGCKLRSGLMHAGNNGVIHGLPLVEVGKSLGIYSACI